MSAFGNIKVPLPELWAYEKNVGKLIPCLAVCVAGTVLADVPRLHSVSHLFAGTGQVKEAIDFFSFHMKDGFEAFMFSASPAALASLIWTDIKSKGNTKIGITYNHLRKAILIPNVVASTAVFVASIGYNLVKKSNGFDWVDMGCETVGALLTIGAGLALARSVRPARQSASLASISASGGPAG